MHIVLKVFSPTAYISVRVFLSALYILSCDIYDIPVRYSLLCHDQDLITFHACNVFILLLNISVCYLWWWWLW